MVNVKLLQLKKIQVTIQLL